jgi:hypothetical protein
MRTLRALPLAFVLAAGCTITTGNTVAESGKLEVHWTIAGSVDPAACSVNGAAGARIDVIDANGAKVNAGADTQTCSAFGVSFPRTFAAGVYTVAVTLTGADGADVTTAAESTFTIYDAQITQAPFDFPTTSFLHPTTGAGSLEVDWSIEGSKDATFCTSHGVAYARIDVLSAGTKVNTDADSQTCSAFATSFTSAFPAGSYTVDVTLVDASGTALTTTASTTTTIAADGTVDIVAVDFPTSSFF